MDKNIVILDLDGTLALIDHRRHFVQGKGSKATKEDWANFYAACVDDKPNEPVIAVLRMMRIWGIEVVIFSGRGDEVREQTQIWLLDNEIPYDKLRMRPEGDYTPDEKLKEKWLEEFDQSKILCVFDDRQKVVDMWRSKGLACFQVAPGDF